MIDLSKKTAAFIVPTGVGASIGGFAGDGILPSKIIATPLFCVHRFLS